MKKFILLLFLLNSLTGLTQNLVHDPSFEATDSTFHNHFWRFEFGKYKGLSHKGRLNFNWTDWETPLIESRTGENAYFLHLTIHGNTSLATILKQPLKKDSIYTIKAFVKIHYKKHHTGKNDNLIVGFSKDSINYENIRKNKVSFVPLKYPKHKNGQYNLCVGKYKAKGGEQFFVLNNPLLREVDTNHFSSILFIDDVSVINSDENFKIPEEKPTFPIAKTFRAQSLFFDSGKHRIQAKSFAYLDSLVLFLNENQRLQINITAYADNQNSEQFNQQLSEHRAKAVEDYLIKKGIAAERIFAKGLGETMFIAHNDNEEGRRQNRRVELSFTHRTIND